MRKWRVSSRSCVCHCLWVLFGTDFGVFLWENHEEYLLLLITHSTAYYLDPGHSNTPVGIKGKWNCKKSGRCTSGQCFSHQLEDAALGWSEMCPHGLTTLLMTVKGMWECARRYTCLVGTPVQSKEFHTKAELSFTVQSHGLWSFQLAWGPLHPVREDPAYSTPLSHGSMFLHLKQMPWWKFTCTFTYLIPFLFLGCRMNRAPTAGYESDVGSKTTHHFVYPESYKELAANVSMILIPFKTLDLRWVVTALTTGTINLWVGQARGVGAPHCMLL